MDMWLSSWNADYVCLSVIKRNAKIKSIVF